MSRLGCIALLVFLAAVVWADGRRTRPTPLPTPNSRGVGRRAGWLPGAVALLCGAAIAYAGVRLGLDAVRVDVQLEPNGGLLLAYDRLPPTEPELVLQPMVSFTREGLVLALGDDDGGALEWPGFDRERDVPLTFLLGDYPADLSPEVRFSLLFPGRLVVGGQARVRVDCVADVSPPVLFLPLANVIRFDQPVECQAPGAEPPRSGLTVVTGAITPDTTSDGSAGQPRFDGLWIGGLTRRSFSERALTLPLFGA